MNQKCALTISSLALVFAIGGAAAQDTASPSSSSANQRMHLRDTWPLSGTFIADPLPLSPQECESLGGTIHAHASCETMGVKCVVKTADGKEHHTCITEAKSK
jgi:hypothetical protein